MPTCGSFVAYLTDTQALETTDSIGKTLSYFALLDEESELKARAEAAESFIRRLVMAEQDGSLNESQARAELREYIAANPIGNEGYFYAVDYRGVLRAHSVNSIVETSILIEPVFNEIIRSGDGFITYDWANPGEEEPRPKTGFVVDVPQWEMYVVASNYSDGLLQRIPSNRLQDLLNGLLTSSIRAIRIDADDRLVATSEGYEEQINRLPETPAPSMDSDVFHPRNGVYYVSRPIENFDATVSVVYQPIGNRVGIQRYAVMIVIGVVLSVGVLALLSNSIARLVTAPIRSVTDRLTSRIVGARPSSGSTKAVDAVWQLVFQQLRVIHLWEREQRQRAIAENNVRLAETAFTNMGDGICVTDADGTIIRVNAAFERITGYSSLEAVGNNPRILKSTRHSAEFYESMWKTVSTDGRWSGEIWNTRKDGTEYPELLTISRVSQGLGDEISFVGVFHDITEIQAAQEQLQYAANHDALTGLPNRHYVDGILDHAIRSAKRERTRVAVLFIDIDNFKDINDGIGHSAGDMLLQWTAGRLRNALRDGDVVARFGGDEYVVILENLRGRDEVATVAQKLLDAAHGPYTLEGQTIRPTISIGIAIFPDTAEDQESLLRNADAAMYEAKRNRKNDYRFHDPVMNVEAHRRFAMQGEIVEAIQNDELSVLYQPLFGAESRTIIGAEALVRWHRLGELVPPDMFLPFIENTTAITQLDFWVLQHVASRLATITAITPTFFVTINAAAIDFSMDHFSERFLKSIDDSGLDRRRIRLEITESAAVYDFEKTRTEIRHLQRNSIKVYLDDFGSGYSSIRYLKELGVDAVKLDRSIAKNLATSKATQSLVGGFIDLAHGLNLQAVIEGIESEDEMAVATRLGADCIQGYLIGKPMEFESLLEMVNKDDPLGRR